MKVQSWFVYMVRCTDGSLYTGITTELTRRVAEHNSDKAARYTRSRQPVTLVYYERAASRSVASQREFIIKKLKKKQKEILIMTQFLKKTEQAFNPNDPCLFCHPRRDEIILETEHALLIKDSFPVSPGHCLVVPRRHIATVFEASEAENQDFYYLIGEAKKHIEKTQSPDGYNLGCNNGEAAGQSIFHLHMHIIPRYKGDVDNPKGGVRWVVPKKASYQLPEVAR